MGTEGFEYTMRISTVEATRQGFTDGLNHRATTQFLIINEGLNNLQFYDAKSLNSMFIVTPCIKVLFSEC